jgi:hypothetical protein
MKLIPVPRETMRLIPVPQDDQEVAAPKTMKLVPVQEEERDPQYVRQFGAGVIDLLGGPPALAGLAETALIGVPKAIHRSWVDDEDFLPALADEFLNSAGIKAAGAVHKFANETMGVGEPEGWEQGARLLPSLFPLGSGVVSSGAGKLSSLLGITSAGGRRAMELGAQIATPMIQVPQGASKAAKLASIGIQGGLTVGIDQGLRSYLDQPTILSGGTVKLVPAEDELSRMALAGVAATAAILGRNFIVQRNAAKTRDVSVIGNIPATDPKTKLPVLDQVKGSISDARDNFVARARAIGVPEEEIENILELLKTDYISMAQAQSMSGEWANSGVKSRKSLAELQSDIDNLDDYTRKVLETGIAADQEMKNRYNATMQQLSTNNAAYRKANIERHTKRIADNLKKLKEFEDGIPGTPVDPKELEKRIRRTARINDYHAKRILFWQKYGDGAYITGKSGKKYKIGGPEDGETSIYDKSFSLEEQKKFLEDIEAPLIRTGLYTNDFKEKFIKELVPGEKRHLSTEAQLTNTINRMKNNPAAMDVVRNIDDFTASALDYLVKKGRLNEQTAALWKRNHTLDGLRLYLPGREATTTSPSALMRLRYLLGWSTPEANETISLFEDFANKALKVESGAIRTMPGNLEQQAVSQGKGITNPVQAIPALQQYVAGIIEHANMNNARVNALDLLARRVGPDSLPETVAFPFETFNPEFPIKKELIKENQPLIDRFIPGYGKNDLDPNNIVTLYKNGTGYRYWVPDAELRNSIDIMPHYRPGFLGMMNKMRGLNQLGTSRNIFFAPVQAMFSTQFNMVTAPTHGIRYTPWDAAKGIGQLLSLGMRNESKALYQRWFGDTLVGSPEAAAHFSRDFENHLFGKFMRETGGLHSSTSLQDAQTRMPDVLERWSGASSLPGNTYGFMKGVYRYLSIVNHALQDGPMWGLQLKILNKELAAGKTMEKAALRANRVSKQIAGDFVARNSNLSLLGQFTEAARASFPFMSATIQGMRAIGHSFKKDPQGTGLRILAYVVLPTIAEVTMINLWGSDEQKAQYWGGDRTNLVANAQIMMPDGTTQRIAFDPTFRLPRAITISVLDAMTGWSNDATYLINGEMKPPDDLVTAEWKRTVSAGLAAMFNIAPPPLLQAGAAIAFDQSAIIGFDPNNDPLVPGLTGMPLAGNKISAFGRESMEFPEGLISSKLHGVMSAIIGYIGDMSANIAEAFNMGDGPITEKTARAFEEFAYSTSRYARLEALLGTDEYVKSRSNAISLELRDYKKNLDTAANVVSVINKFGMQANLVPSDPTVLNIATAASNLKNSKPYRFAEGIISQAFQTSTNIKTTDRIQPQMTTFFPELGDRIGEPWTRQEKVDAQNKLTKIIMEQQLTLLYMIKQMEKDMGISLSVMDTNTMPKSITDSLSSVVPGD